MRHGRVKPVTRHAPGYAGHVKINGFPGTHANGASGLAFEKFSEADLILYCSIENQQEPLYLQSKIRVL